MSDSRSCICGHSESMHFGGTTAPYRCMKIITRHDSGNVSCTCQEFRPDSRLAPPAPDGEAQP